MSSTPQEVFAQRLVQARRMQGLSLRALSERLDGFVSYAALHKYEQGLMLPGSDVLIRLAQALQQSIDFFFRPLSVSLEKIEFRKRSKLGKKVEAEVKERAADYFERYLELEELLGLAHEFSNPLKGFEIRKPDDIETAAERLRDDWELGRDAIPNVVELLEARDIKVFQLDASEDFDGFASWAGTVPVMVLNQCFPVDRRRLTALHELGHLVLKFSSQFDAKEVEKLCHAFASAVLMPQAVFVAEFGGQRARIAVNELCDIKSTFGLSLAAIMSRAYRLGLISEARYKSFFIECSKRGWRKKEPGEFAGNEKSTRFDQLLSRAVATEAITLTKAAALTGKSLSAFRRELDLLP